MPHSTILNHEDLEDHDLILLAEVSAQPIKHQVEAPVRPQKKNTSIDTIETDSRDYDFDIAYGRAEPDDQSLSNEPIIRVKEEDFEAHLEGQTDSQHRRKMWIAILCLVVLIAIIVGAVVGTNSASSQGGQLSSQSVSQEVLSQAPSEAPTQPTGSPTESAAPSVHTPFQIIADELSLTGDGRPTDETTAVYKAIAFLAEEYTNSGELLPLTRLSQRYAVANVYFALGGPHWSNRLGFLSSQHECQWRDIEGTLIKGVICDESESDVDYISLSSNNLTGTIPEQIGLLTNMQNLDMSYNVIGGTIPDGLANAKRMQRLTLNSNRLTGTVPAFASKYGWKNLTFLSIEQNFLTGNISSLCVLDGAFLRADCLGGDDAEILCSCCRFCCSKNRTCSGMNP